MSHVSNNPNKLDSYLGKVTRKYTNLHSKIKIHSFENENKNSFFIHLKNIDCELIFLSDAKLDVEKQIL